MTLRRSFRPLRPDLDKFLFAAVGDDGIPSQFWVACFVLAAAVLLSAVVHGGFTFGIGIP